jgi:hypothetical protein
MLCWERFTKSDLYTPETAKSVAKAPAVRKFMVQIDQDKKAQRVASRTWKQADKQIRSDSDADDDVADKSSSDDEKVVDVETVETMLDKIAQEKEIDREQKETLLGLFRD